MIQLQSAIIANKLSKGKDQMDDENNNNNDSDNETNKNKLD